MSRIGPEWFKSSYSGGDGDNCIEVAVTPRAVLVRDTKDREGGQLSVTPAAWADFVAFAKAVEL
ncbi:DUF397 domain-containing protein [Streptomyces sp. CMB-StM0423]|uniref:DUF397 domain-containing protein n=1 Tax=Streptomyces sp. CMB-StM0423 TaxID=2059884 RepID=UPI000C71338E|nr:DUF397 domain-containing protein [Streptomyces sp. CMB-StM0423]AUH39897.1 DUF397 domain-containing protein [Streptomyces sp. CMB-StM0423]